MILSDEQMGAAFGGGVAGWAPVERPTGRFAVPDWVRGAHINWHNGYGNAPDVTLKALGSLYRWPDQRWVKEGVSTYISRHPDGRASILYHDGAVSLCGAWRIMRAGKQETHQWRVVDPYRGEAPKQTALRKANEHMAQVAKFSMPEEQAERTVEVKAVKATSLQGGFGGDGYWLTMMDGSELVLRGPWHGGAPAGYVETGVCDVTAESYIRDTNSRWYRGKPWFQRGGGPSVYLTEELYLRIMARYCPHAPIARVKHGYGARLEPFRAEWEAPKALIYELEIERARKGEPAGPFWRVYWDSTGGYCGSLRMPTHGFQEGVAA